MFNIRVYGLWIRNDHVLLTDEEVKGKMVTKFPGGGLESGEGVTDCLIREFHEELDVNINVLKHIYTTEFFVPSAFKAGEQVISIYYQVGAQEFIPVAFPSFRINEENKQSFYWLPLQDLNPDNFSFPIDKFLVEQIIANKINL